MKRKYLILFCFLPFCFRSHAQAYIINTFAGDNVAGYSGDGFAATSAELNEPWGVAVDRAGNVYIAEYNNHRIRKVSTTGIITTVAGNGTNGFSGDGFAATSAQLNFPTGVAVDSAGNIYIADEDNQRIRKVNTAGIISTYAGTGGVGFSGDGFAATSATFDVPEAVAVDKKGNLYICDFYNYCVRKVNSSGIISTVAGNQINGYSGDGFAATSASMGPPLGVGVDNLGNIYIGDESNARVRKVNSSGIISTIAGDGTQGYSGDGGLATSAEVAYPYGICTDTLGNIYIADYGNARLRMINPAGTITTIAGDSTSGYSGDGGLATQASMSSITDVAVNSTGNIFIADVDNNVIRILKKDSINPQCQSWGNVGSVGFSASGAATVSLALSGNVPYVAFTDAAHASAATVMNYNGTTWQTIGTAGFSPGAAYSPSLAFSGTTPYIAFQDAAHGSKATAMNYNGTSWVSVGSADFSAGTASYISLAFSGAAPYVAYQDGMSSNAATVMDYTGGVWQTVGTAGFTPNQANYVSLAMSGAAPYIAFSDGSVGYKASVMKYNGSAWVYVGAAGFSAGFAFGTSIAFDNTGKPYVAYQDAYNSNRLTVMEYSAGSWQVVGVVGFSDGAIQHPTVAVLGTTPYVAFEDAANADKITVMEFNAGAWITVGTHPGISAGTAYAPSLAFAGLVPYVAFQDAANASKATVMSFSELSDSVKVLGNINCNGDNNGSASVTVFGGSSPYTYLWLPGGYTNATVTGLSGGTYTVTLSDHGVNGCALTNVVTITQPSGLISISMSVQNDQDCYSTAWARVGGGIKPYTYEWSPIHNTTDSVSHLCPGNYCLKVTDAHGCMDSTCFTLKPQGVENIESASGEITVYPNPSTGIVNCELSMVNENTQVEVYNVLGEKVYSQFNIHNSQFTIDLSSNPNGIYLYRVLSNNGDLIGEGKMIIQK